MVKNELQTLPFRRRRRAFMLMPLVVIPFLFLFFISLGGGRGKVEEGKAPAAGYNRTLPAARFEKKPEAGKLDYYRRADQDSIRRKEYLRQDPYFRREGDTLRTKVGPREEEKPDELMEKLENLKKMRREPSTRMFERERRVAPLLPTLLQQETMGRRTAGRFMTPMGEMDSTGSDPELMKLDGMLDKILRIQHPKEEMANTSEMAGDTMAANSIPAVVREDQALVAGSTVALRLTEEVRINGVVFPKDQLAYGVVSISNDRMLVTVSSLRKEQSIYSTALQVYDMDGLPGIHIPGDVGRETAKQSAEQSINTLGYVGMDGSPVSQVTNAGVQAARTLLSRKVRMVRVGVPAGYRVLLRSTKALVKVQRPAASIIPDSIRLIPDASDFVPFMHARVREEGVVLTLESMYLRDSLLWFCLRLKNRSPIGYKPDYMHWSIRDRHRQRRTAMQELPLTPVYSTPVETVAGDSGRVVLVGFQPFALPGDKELVLQLAEGNGARALEMKISGRQVLKARSYGR